MIGRREKGVCEARSGECTDAAAPSSGAPRTDLNAAPSQQPIAGSNLLTRRSLLRSGFAALAAAPFAKPLAAAPLATPPAASSPSPRRTRRNVVQQADDIVLGMSAAFSGPSRGLGTELYRGAMAYFGYVNDNGGVNGRRIVLKLYDDGYQPDTSVANTIRLMQEDEVFLLFGYVGTPTVTRVLPLLKRFSDQQVYLFFPFTGAEPQREPPYGEFAFNLRASYRQETAGLVDNFVRIGRRRVAVFYQVDAYGRSGWAGVREALARHGETIAAEATYRRGTPFGASMRRQVQILQAGSPDAVICIGTYAACAAFARDAVDLGLHVPVANLSFVGSENLQRLLRERRSDPDAYTRFLVNSQVVPAFDDATFPSVNEYHRLMFQYDPQLPGDLHRLSQDVPYQPLARGFVSLEGFLNAKLMTEILRRVGGRMDRSRLEQAVFSVRNFPLGIGESVSFAPNRRQGMQRVYYTVGDGDHFALLYDWEARFGTS